MPIFSVSSVAARALFVASLCAAAGASAGPLNIAAAAPILTKPALQTAGTGSPGGQNASTGLGKLGPVGQAVGDILDRLSGNYVIATAGTTSTEGYIVSDGLARRYILIRPDTVSAGAPVLMLLHPRGLSPEKMANLTRAARLAAQYGAWVYLPEGLFHTWNDNPDSVSGPDDVAFLRRLIDSSVVNSGVDASRIFIAGYSNGGFMAERAACELSSRIAGLATIAASLRDSVEASCRPSHHLPVIQFHGTGDLIVPYNGIPTISSAPAASAFWAQQSQCSVGQTRANAVPNASRDGTRVEVTSYSICAPDTAVALYTVDHGGHTWPGANDKLFTVELGRTTSDVDATLELWRFFSPFSLK